MDIQKIEMPNLAELEQRQKDWNNRVKYISVRTVLTDELTKYFNTDTLGLRIKLALSRDNWKLNQFLKGKAKISYGEIYNYTNGKGIHKQGSVCLV